MAAREQTPVAVLVTFEVPEDRVPEVMSIMERDSLGSRHNEPGCTRFDCLRVRGTANKFMLFEVYKDEDALQAHAKTPHYLEWKAFTDTGVLTKKEKLFMDTTSIPGGFGLQANNAPSSAMASGVFVTVDIKPDRVDDFLKAMQVDVTMSRDKLQDPGCLRFDLLRCREKPNSFIFYEAYVDDDAAAAHKKTAHYKAWADFKESGGVENQTVEKVEAVTPWCFQAACGSLGNSQIPLLGFGTYKVGTIPAAASSAVADGGPPAPEGPEVCQQVVKDALASGYAMFDCAEFYMNEPWVGDALKSAGTPRRAVYIVSKVWDSTIYKGPDAVKAQVDKSIADLQCDYIDLMLVHWPVPGKHVAAYNALRECKAAGKVREIGLSNYCIEDYEELRAAGAFGPDDVDKPACNQIEVNPFLFRRKTIEFFQKEGVHIQAYRGLGQGPKAWDDATIQEICKEIGRSAPQVLGRFLVQQGISHIPKASSPARMIENAAIFDFELTDAQMEKLKSLTTREALLVFKTLYTKCIWRETPEESSPCPGERTLD